MPSRAPGRPPSAARRLGADERLGVRHLLGQPGGERGHGRVGGGAQRGPHLRHVGGGHIGRRLLLRRGVLRVDGGRVVEDRLVEGGQCIRDGVLGLRVVAGDDGTGDGRVVVVEGGAVGRELGRAHAERGVRGAGQQHHMRAQCEVDVDTEVLRSRRGGSARDAGAGGGPVAIRQGGRRASDEQKRRCQAGGRASANAPDHRVTVSRAARVLPLAIRPGRRPTGSPRSPRARRADRGRCAGRVAARSPGPPAGQRGRGCRRLP